MPFPTSDFIRIVPLLFSPSITLYRVLQCGGQAEHNHRLARRL